MLGISKSFIFFLLLSSSSFAGFTLDGVDDNVSCNGFTSLNGATSFTISFWVNPSLTQGTAIAKWQDGTTQFIVTTQTGGYPYVATTYSYWNTTTYKWETGKWRHFLWTWVAGTSPTNTVYIDGTSKALTLLGEAPCTQLNTSTSTLFFGTQNQLHPEYSHFGGTIDEIAIWKNTTLSAAKITLLSSSTVKGIPLQIEPSNLVMYRSTDEGETGTSMDGVTTLDRSATALTCTGDNGANNTGMTWLGISHLSYPQSPQ